MTHLAPADPNARNYRHGHKPQSGASPEYVAWNGMRARCHNPSNPNYARYGARGIRVCEAWRNSFETFLSDMGRKPSTKHSIERINNNGNYEPSNCRWATATEQANNRRSSRVIKFNEEEKTLAEWSRLSGVSVTTIYQRIKYGWSIERALTQPVKMLVRKDRRHTGAIAKVYPSPFGKI